MAWQLSNDRADRRIMTTSAASLDTVAVVGGSIAGLLAAAAAHDHAERVVVLERSRALAPQSVHTHGLLGSGRAAIESLLPGFTERVRARGGISAGDIGATSRWWIGGGLLAECEVGLSGLVASRPLVQQVLRELVSDLPRVELVEAPVEALLGDATAVTGLRVRAAADRSADLECDLTVDATGRAGRGWGWLGDLGVAVPEQEEQAVGLRYATVHVPAYDDDLDGRVGAISPAAPGVPHGGVALRQEDGTWSISLFTYDNGRLPQDPDGLRQVAAGLVSPDLAVLLSRPHLHEPRSYRFPHGRRRLLRHGAGPLGHAAIGDALACIDPAFGQGMSVAALEALELRDSIRRGLIAVRDDYPLRAAEVVDRAWRVVDPGQPGLLTRYVQRLLRVARRDPVAAAAFLRVTNLVAPGSSLLRPSLAVRVLIGS
jgi:2-polyprenyl-6-methoxyphenol hydroxylase-like FAD-dependent oxidoreductase